MLGSFITSAMGIGGGVVLIAALATFVPAAAIIPLHGIVQLGSNVGRATIQRAYIDWRTFIYFGIGAAVGVSIGGSVVVSLPANALRIGLALFILFLIWGPKLRFASSGDTAVLITGIVASILTMFFGATGAFITSLLTQRDYTPHALVATHAVCMSIQHALKIVVFGVLGFAFGEWLGLVALMMISGLLGTYLGSLVLNRLPKEVFAKGLKAILTILALNLLAQAFGLYGG